MSNYIPENQKHLSLEDRFYIGNSLNKRMTFKNIARYLCKDPSTILYEVRAHRLSEWYHKGTFCNAKNFCIHRYNCRKPLAFEAFYFCCFSSYMLLTPCIFAERNTVSVVRQVL